MVSIFDINSSLAHLKYYADRSTGRYVCTSNEPVDRDDLIEVPSIAVNKYQYWDGDSWTGSTDDLETRYGNFRIAMLSSSGWQRMKNLGGATAVPEFGTAIAFMNENPGMVKYLWNAIVEVLPDDQPTASEVVEWRAIVTTTEIGIEWIGDRVFAFDFTDEGYMI